MKAKKIILLVVSLPPLIVALLYGGGVIGQFISGYLTWQNGGGIPGDGTSPPLPTLDFFRCIGSAFSFPYGVACILICLIALAILIFFMRMNSGDGGAYDKERNFNYSDKGTYGTSGFMTEREVKEVLDLTNDLRKHTGTVLGLLDGQFVCVPKETRLNANMAVYGASGSMKTRSFCVNRILQSAAGGESLIVCDPKSELYEKTSEYMRDKGYTDDRVLLSYFPFKSLEGYASLKLFFGDTPFSLCGYPTVNSNLYEIEVSTMGSVAVFAESINLGGCKEFLDFLLSDEIQASQTLASLALPVTRTAMEILIDENRYFYYSKKTDTIGDLMGGTGTVLLLSALSSGTELDSSLANTHTVIEITDQDKNKILNLLDHSTAFNNPDETLRSIVHEELSVYRAGVRSLEETTKIIDSRVWIYLNE